MWQLIPTVLFLTYVDAFQRPGAVNSPYPFVIEDRLKPPQAPPGPYVGYAYPPVYISANRAFKPVYTEPLNYDAGFTPQWNPFNTHHHDRFVYNGLDKYRTQNNLPLAYPLRTYNFRQTQGLARSLYQVADGNPFDSDYGSSSGGSDLSFSDSDPLIEPRSGDSPSYAEALELVENFGNYLRKRTYIDPQAPSSPNDAAHQYNALLAVLIALARVVRNSCADYEQVYDQVYQNTVESNYNFGLTNAHKVTELIEEYIRKGNSHIPKLKKLMLEVCDKELFCSATLDNRIKSSPLTYVKELETLEALAHLARSFYPYIEEFNQASQKGAVLAYLQKSKDRLKDYIMHIINSVEHISDRQVKCT